MTAVSCRENDTSSKQAPTMRMAFRGVTCAAGHSSLVTRTGEAITSDLRRLTSRPKGMQY
ncbi:hypothetical protein ACHAXH_007948 [Discostella pseudostelligera]